MSKDGPFPLILLTRHSLTFELSATLSWNLNNLSEICIVEDDGALKKTGRCPKCQNRGIATNKVRARMFGLGARVYIPAGNLRTSTLKAYVCLKCGYSELYADEKGLKNLKTYFRKRKGIQKSSSKSS